MPLMIAVLPLMLYAGYKDMKHRIIPDKVHIILIFIGLSNILLLDQSSIFYLSVSERIAGLVPAAILFFIYILGKDVGGGDLKIIGSAGFCMGIHGIMIILLISCIGGILVFLFRKEERIPLATFMAIGTIIYFLSLFL